MTEAETKPRVQTAARTIHVITCVAQAGPEGISAKEISESLGLPRQVIYHLLHTLLEIGFLRKAGRSGYLLGLGAASIADGFRRQVEQGNDWRRYAIAAAEATSETAYVIGWIMNEVVAFASVRGHATVTAAEPMPCISSDAHSRASGKLSPSCRLNRRSGGLSWPV